ncbi:hypothetical protein DFH28DRAFT_976001 [Melampsora americana]|nr:hypothetical protein DFH28DRAFT_976001 [Melampsora americana]
MKSSTVYVLMMIICVTFGVLGKQENTKTETKVDKVAQKITCGGGGELITTGVIKAWCMKMGPSGPKPVKFKCNKNKLAFCDKGYSLHHTKAEKYPCKSKGHTETKPDPKKYPLKCT